VMSNTRAGQPLSFAISGTGTLTDPGDDSLGAPHPVREEAVAPPAPESGQRGGVSSTAVGSDSPERNRWYVLGGMFLVLLAGGGFYLVRRSRRGSVVRSGVPDRKGARRQSPGVRSSSPSDLLLDRLKNELFQLEVKHQQGRISAREYKRARAAVGQALDRVIKPAPRK
jgi:LPXTG-motif cell wall-anchored protein